MLSPQGHIEHALYGVDDGETFWAHTEPGAAAAAAAWLDRMRFMMRVEVADRSEDYAVVWRPEMRGSEPSTGSGHVVRSGPDSLGGHEIFVPRAELEATLAAQPAGRNLGVRGAAHRARRAAHRTGLRPPHHPE